MQPNPTFPHMLPPLTLPNEKVVFDRFWVTAFPFADVLPPEEVLADLSERNGEINKGRNVVRHGARNGLSSQQEEQLGV